MTTFASDALGEASIRCTTEVVRVVAISDLRGWADEVIGLDTSGPFPTRVVLVPTEAHAHALRRKIVVREPRVLAGTRFLTIGAAARSVLDAAGVAYRTGEENLRALRVRKVLHAGTNLAAYRGVNLFTRGWEEAFASTIEQLEAAALSADDLERLDDPRMRDLAAIWRTIDTEAGCSWTLPRIINKARECIEAWPFEGPVLAAVTPGIDAVDARFVRALPRLTLAMAPGRPVRNDLSDRARALLGDEAASAISRVGNEQRQGEIGLLSELFFEPPARLTASDRRRSTGPDGTVSLELYAGIDEELDAAARWVAEEVCEHGTPLQEIAVLVPRPDPYAALVAARIRALAWPDDIESVYVACGIMASSTSAGARLLALVRAVRDHLPADAVATLLPRLRLVDDDGHVTPGQARTLVDALATIGGSATRPRDALRWSERLGRDDLPEFAASIRPALAALVAVAEKVLADASLPKLWQAIEQFVTTYLFGTRELDTLVTQLAAEISSLAADPVTEEITGVAALELVVQRLEVLRVHAGRYGQPSIYVGTISSAAGLAFSAVRVLGLAEGVYPGTLREDALLPHSLRRRLPPHAMQTEDEYATARLQALDRVVRDTSERIVFSAARTDLDGSEREPASLFIEAAAALGRPNAQTGEAAHAVPSMSDLDRDAFRVARAARETRRSRAPLTEHCWLARAAAERVRVPSAWSQLVVTDPSAMAARMSTMNGLLGPAPLTVTEFGLDPERPLSASAIRMLLTCPQRFLLERMIGFRPKRARAPSHRIDPDAYGKLLHRILDRFSRAHGRDFGAREHDLSHWMEIAHSLVDDELATLAYALVGDGVADTERRRLRRDVQTFLTDDWNDGHLRTFMYSEQEFGPVPIPSSTGSLFVRGWIDRIDIEHGVTLVRDLKTSRPRPRERDDIDPSFTHDLQLGVYVAVVRALASEWNVPADVAAAYAYVDGRVVVRERAFREDRGALVEASQDWLDLASALIRERLFVRTPNPEDCRWCPFAPVCGDQTVPAAELLQDASGSLAVFRDLKE